MPTILVLETATLSASVAVLDGPAASAAPARVLGRAHAAVTTHSEMLLGLVSRALDEARLTPATVDAVGCGAGPGSFTGLRIGLCTAKGLCFAVGKPLVMASSLRALALAAAPAAGEALVGAVFDAKKGEVFCGFYRGAAAEPVAAEVALPPADFAAHAAAVTRGAPFVLVGSGVRAYPDEVGRADGARILDAPAGPDAVDVGRLCLLALGAGGAVDLAAAAPAYVRPSEAEVVRRRRGGP